MTAIMRAQEGATHQLHGSMSLVRSLVQVLMKVVHKYAHSLSNLGARFADNENMDYGVNKMLLNKEIDTK